VQIGDTFLSRDRRIDDHLHVVISDPGADASRVVIVSVTSYDKFAHEIYKDSSCILRPKDRPRIRHETCISHRDGRVLSEDLLDKAVAAGTIAMEEPASNGVLTRILEGAERTDELPNKCRVILEQQGLIQA
jgi:hypothetical protein